jgi:hypothetical protein
MSRKTAERLPCLAHPIYIKPGNEKNNEKGLFLPPYPEIDLKNWAGFFFSHVSWMGFNTTYPEQKQAPYWEFYRDLTHEVSHKYQAFSRFTRCINCHMFMFWIQILSTFEEAQEEIPVPLRPDLARNELEREWKLLITLQKSSELVEEVFAVQSSLSAGPHLTVGVTDTIAQSRPTSLVSGGRAFWVASIAQAERDTRATHVHSNTGA